MAGCGDVLSLEDLQTAKKHQIFEAEVITGKAGGVAGGAAIDYATNQVTGQVQKTLPALLLDVGFTQASFEFITGGTLTTSDRDKAVYDPVSKAWYIWLGPLPKVVPATTNPLLDAYWKPWTDPTLRADLAAYNGLSLVGGAGYLTIEQFGAVRGDSSRSYAPEIQAALNASATTGKTIRDSGTYYINGTDVLTVPGPSYPHSLSIDSDNLVFDFSLRDAVASSVTVGFGGVSGSLMSGGGSAGPAVALPSATYNSQTITTTGVNAGDLLLIYSDDTRDGDVSPQEIGELNYVQAVSGATVTLESKLKDNYATNPKYRVITPLKSPRIRGLKLKGKGRQVSGVGDIGLVLLFAERPDVAIDIEDVDQVGVDLIACKGGRLSGYAEVQTKGASGSLQYPYRYSSGTCDLNVDVTCNLSRHAVNGGSNVNIPGINRNIRVKGSATGTWSAAFATHNGDELTDFDVVATSCEAGVDIRVGGCSVSRLEANQTTTGVLLRKDVRDVSMLDVIGRDCSSVVYVLTSGKVSSSTGFSGITAESIKAYDCTSALLIDATIDPIPVSMVAQSIRGYRCSSVGGRTAQIRLNGQVRLTVLGLYGEDCKNYMVRTEAGAVVYIDTVTAHDCVGASALFAADGAGSEVIIGRLILSGGTTAQVASISNGGSVTVFQTVDMR